MSEPGHDTRDDAELDGQVRDDDGRARAAAQPAADPGEPEGLLELLRRERADFQNYRRRIEVERAEDRKRAAAEQLEEILPALDELDRALSSGPDDLKSDPWVKGVGLAHRRLVNALAELGVVPIGTPGEPFDPAIHEAVFYDPSPEVAEPHVAQVIRRGYRVGSRLMRPAQVGVVGPHEQSGDRGAGPLLGH
ncbi:MAG: nucleotide exchange factor GrpE [Candidatus Limnocylindrales bacterium]